MMNLPDIINPDIPVPGIPTKWGYRHMTEEEYRDFPAINNSLLKCPTLSEMYSMLTTPQRQTDALAIGTLADMAILTPDEPWRERFALAEIPINPSTGKAYGLDTKKAESAFATARAANPGKFVVSRDLLAEYTVELEEIQTAFYESDLCRAALTNSLKQVSGILWHPTWHCWVKWKPDVLPLSPDDKTGWSINDLKTTRHHVLQFEKDCHEFGLFDQAGWYSHCHETLLAKQGMLLRVANFNFLVVGKSDPDARRPRKAMGRMVQVPLDPESNLHMAPFHRRIFPADGFGRVEMFLAALDEHIAAPPDPADSAAINAIWKAYQNDSQPFILCKLPRS